MRRGNLTFITLLEWMEVHGAEKKEKRLEVHWETC